MRKRAGAFIAAFAAMMLIAAGEPTQPVGTAQTSLVAIELDVTGVTSPVQGLTLLDVTTFASTDTDTVKNTAGAPFSSATISPIGLNGENLVDPVTVRSDGDTSESTATLNENVGVASIALNPLGMTATAGADSASATISAATAQVTALSDALGIQLNHIPGFASVDANGATATSGIGVSGVELSLGELLPVDIADLPLDTLLGLANLLQEQLSVTGLDLSALDAATAALEGAVDELTALILNYDTAVGSLNDVIGQINTAAGNLIVEYTGGTVTVSDMQTHESTLRDIVQQAEALLAGDLTLSDITPALITQINGWIDIYSTLEGMYSGCTACDPITLLDEGSLGTDPVATVEAKLGELITEATELADYIDGGLDAITTITTLGAAGGPLDEAVGAVQGALDAIQNFLTTTDLEQLINDLVAELTGLIDLVPDLVNDLDLSSLLDVDPIGVTVSAAATADSAVPSITCGGGRVAVAGVEVVPDIDGCTAVSGAADTMNGALATVRDVLGTLTTVDVPTPALDLFVERRESSGQDGAYRTATAGITALILELPSIDLDAVVQGALDGALSTLSSTDLLGLLESLASTLTTTIASPDTEVTDLIATSVMDAYTAVTDEVTTTTVDTSGVDSAESQLDALLAELADLIAGAVPDTGLKTPGVNMRVDPVSAVEFAPGTAGAPAPPTDPEPQPSLPVTGGGLALLGALAIAGGFALRRRS